MRTAIGVLRETGQHDFVVTGRGQPPFAARAQSWLECESGVLIRVALSKVLMRLKQLVRDGCDRVRQEKHHDLAGEVPVCSDLPSRASIKPVHADPLLRGDQERRGTEAMAECKVDLTTLELISPGSNWQARGIRGES